MKTRQLNLRLEADLVRELEEAARTESLDRGTMLRKLLRQALIEHRRETALRRYHRGELSIGRVAEDTGLSHWEILDLARERGWAYPIDASDLERAQEPGPKRPRRVAERAATYSPTMKSMPRRAGRRSRGADSPSDATLPDRAPSPGGILLIGINPSPASVSAGHYYQGLLGRRLWKRLERLGLLTDAIAGLEDVAFTRSGHGLTDVVKRATPSARDLTRAEMTAGVESLRVKVRAWRPRLIVFTYQLAASIALGTRKVRPGPNTYFEDVPTFVLSSPYAKESIARAIDRQLRDFVLDGSRPQ